MGQMTRDRNIVNRNCTILLKNQGNVSDFAQPKLDAISNLKTGHGS